jgi:hypothetical protein
MKNKTITVELLSKIKACESSIIRFANTEELHNLDVSNITEIETSDEQLFNDISWL